MAFDKDKILISARKYIDREQYEKALHEYEKILEVEPNDDRVLLYMAQCYEKSGRGTEAGQTYVKVSQCYRSQGAYQKALAVLKNAQRYLPENDEVAVGMAELYNALGLQRDAVLQLEKCLQRCEQSQDQRGYLRILQMMVRVDSENVQIRAQYAKKLNESGDSDGARRQYALALAQLQNKEQFTDYVALSQDYLRLFPNDTEILSDLGNVYMRLGQYQEVVSLLSKLKPVERTPEIHELLISSYMRLKLKHQAVEELKRLAYQLTEMGEREDKIEDAWLRARRLASNDVEILAALGEEVPMLSESALNCVAISKKEDRDATTRRPTEVSPAERMLETKYRQALEAYQRGQLDGARGICLQIIDSNDQYQPALRLMIAICDRQHDRVVQAQIERKLARALNETNRDEALRHILNAEKCTPRAWENYNLMLVLGFDPSKYGMSAEDSKPSSHMNSRIPDQRLRNSVAAKPPMLPPNAGRASGSCPPPIPPRPPIPSRPPIPTPDKVQVSTPSVNRQTTPSGQFHFNQIELGKGRVVDDPNESSALGRGLDELGSVVTEELDDLFDAVVRPSGVKSSSKPASLRVYDAHSEAKEVNSPQMERHRTMSTPVAVSSRELSPLLEDKSREVASLSADVPTPSPTLASSRAAVNQTSLYMNAVPGSAWSDPSRANAMRSAPISIQPRAAFVTPVVPLASVEKPAQIPAADRQRVVEAVQEIEFYASLDLRDDAQRLLNDLIQEFGDIDMIHEAKEKLASLGVQ